MAILAPAVRTYSVLSLERILLELVHVVAEEYQVLAVLDAPQRVVPDNLQELTRVDYNNRLHHLDEDLHVVLHLVDLVDVGAIIAGDAVEDGEQDYANQEEEEAHYERILAHVLVVLEELLQDGHAVVEPLVLDVCGHKVELEQALPVGDAVQHELQHQQDELGVEQVSAEVGVLAGAHRGLPGLDGAQDGVDVALELGLVRRFQLLVHHLAGVPEVLVVDHVHKQLGDGQEPAIDPVVQVVVVDGLLSVGGLGGGDVCGGALPQVLVARQVGLQAPVVVDERALVEAERRQLVEDEEGPPRAPLFLLEALVVGRVVCVDAQVQGHLVAQGEPEQRVVRVRQPRHQEAQVDDDDEVVERELAGSRRELVFDQLVQPSRGKVAAAAGKALDVDLHRHAQHHCQQQVGLCRAQALEHGGASQDGKHLRGRLEHLAKVLPEQLVRRLERDAHLDQVLGYRAQDRELRLAQPELRVAAHLVVAHYGKRHWVAGYLVPGRRSRLAFAPARLNPLLQLPALDLLRVVGTGTASFLLFAQIRAVNLEVLAVPARAVPIALGPLHIARVARLPDARLLGPFNSHACCLMLSDWLSYHFISIDQLINCKPQTLNSQTLNVSLDFDSACSCALPLVALGLAPTIN